MVLLLLLLLHAALSCRVIPLDTLEGPSLQDLARYRYGMWHAQFAGGCTAWCGYAHLASVLLLCCQAH
jgi:hypothetical protein